MMSQCSNSGHLYPASPADRAALVSGPNSEAFGRVSMVGLCADHAPQESPAPHFSVQVVRCQVGDPDVGQPGPLLRAAEAVAEKCKHCAEPITRTGLANWRTAPVTGPRGGRKNTPGVCPVPESGGYHQPEHVHSPHAPTKREDQK